jgi:DNA invertase Pin-like site-specific DNA recombinase
MRGKFVAYYRVSTARQGRSGLGLEAQRAAVLTYLNGGSWTLVEEFTEVESGKKTDKQRPELARALKACRLYGATLVVAKLDRLSRNALFTATLMEAGVKFFAVDMPEANHLTIHLYAAMAQHTREAISANTKAALAAAKRRGITLGNPQNLTNAGRKRGQDAGHAVRSAVADQRAEDLAPILAELQRSGIVSTPAIADALNSKGIPAPRGGSWHPITVARVVQRLKAEAEKR